MPTTPHFAPTIRSSRIVKTMRPGQPGAKRRLAQHGDALVCVRYRHDTLGLQRYTTVELVTDIALIDPKRFARSNFGVYLRPRERQLRLALVSAGARWNDADGLWWVRGATIVRLGLVDRISKR